MYNLYFYLVTSTPSFDLPYMLHYSKIGVAWSYAWIWVIPFNVINCCRHPYEKKDEQCFYDLRYADKDLFAWLDFIIAGNNFDKKCFNSLWLPPFRIMYHVYIYKTRLLYCLLSTFYCILIRQTYTKSKAIH